MALNNKIYRIDTTEEIAAFKYASDAKDYIENESYGYEKGLTLIDDNGRTYTYVLGQGV